MELDVMALDLFPDDERGLRKCEVTCGSETCGASCHGSWTCYQTE